MHLFILFNPITGILAVCVLLILWFTGFIDPMGRLKREQKRVDLENEERLPPE